ncbi:hypothetical protein BT96DRAFT_459528 [Gymnopus androsaceus JB14]|uniref:C2H2-type domain-containing protein n=1 Tax=Gymnopus androsaceus JB14 TaxID=1447944 RepID=A0A6A4IIS3_9AGAR|nr:hypothetical protein BT96DRAFT_459528 [Gymnopus androsaceus JB14]
MQYQTPAEACFTFNPQLLVYDQSCDTIAQHLDRLNLESGRIVTKTEPDLQGGGTRRSDGRFHCSFIGCKKSYTAKHNLQYHFDYKHLGVEKKCACMYCEDRFTGPRARDRHQRKCQNSHWLTRTRRTRSTVYD